MEYPLQNQFSHVRKNEIKIENFTPLQQQMFIYMRRNEKEQGWNEMEWNQIEKLSPHRYIYIYKYIISRNISINLCIYRCQDIYII